MELEGGVARSTTAVGRRGFLKGAAAGAAAIVARTVPTDAAAQEPAAVRPATPAAPASAQLRADTEPPARDPSPRLIEKPASDFMVDVIKSLGIEYAAVNPGSSFEGLHESIINYGGNTAPEFITSSRTDKFAGNDLEKRLKDKGIDTVILVGTSANGAVMTTATMPSIASEKQFAARRSIELVSSPTPIVSSLVAKAANGRQSSSS
jgi:hypothetical protein